MLIVEPDDGLQPVLDFINSAQSSLLIKQFTFTEPSLVEATIARHKAGVEVRVMLNAQRSGGDRANDETYEQLHHEGIDVQWANPKFYVTHEKSIVVDRKAAMVATYNLMIKYVTLTRDYGIITHDPGQVAQILAGSDAVDLVRAGARGKPFWHAEAQAGPLWLQPQVLKRPREDGRIAAAPAPRR